METLKERFEKKFTQTDGCWEWTACKYWDGYGKFRIDKQMQRASRVSYQLYVGEIPEGMCILHHCDNRGCVRPDHLFLGTKTDNMRDCIAKGRCIRASGEKHGNAKLTGTQVKTIRARRSDGACYVDLAREFAVSLPTISKIVLCRRWRHL